MTGYKSFDRVAHVYDETRGLPPEAEAAIADGIAAVAREVAPSPRLLEVGIGTGRIAVPLAERGLRVAGIDISPAMVAVLRGKRVDIDVVFAEAARPPFRDAAFDAALFVHILHLVPDAEATVRATIQLMRGGGVVILGGDDHGDIRREADRIVREVTHDVGGVDIERSTSYAGTIVLAERILGAHRAVLQRSTIAKWTSSTTAKRMTERLAARDFSSSWRIPDDKLGAIVDEARRRLTALFGDYDRPAEYQRSFSIVTARLPSA